jgi:rhodanese-related sulfurtransferase
MSKSREEMLADARARVREVTPKEAMGEIEGGAVLLDCREPQEYHMAHIPGAVFIPLGQVESKVLDEIPKEKKVVVYCARGNRSLFAADMMRELGYSDVASMSGGIGAWADAGGDIE